MQLCFQYEGEWIFANDKTEPGGYLLWDDSSNNSMRTFPPSETHAEVWKNIGKFGDMVGFDRNLPYTVATLCKERGLKVATFENDS